MRKGFVLKDNRENYVSAGSIHYYEESKRLCYSYSKYITNGFFTSPTRKMAQTELDKLNQAQARFQLSGKQFHVEEIQDMDAVILEESKLPEVKVGYCPFKHKYIEFDDGKDYAWVVRDNHNNLAHARSFKTIDNELLYISYQTFGPECRAYMDLLKAERVMDVLNWEVEKMRLNDTTFHLEYVDLGEATKQHLEFDGENMVITEKKQVA